MKKILAVALATLAFSTYLNAETYTGTDIQVVEKGVNNAHEAQAPEWVSQIKDSDAQPRQWLYQAPVIPHSITGMQISKNTNRCLDCHSPEGAEITGATLPSKTHYLSREDKLSTAVSPRRHFCVQCHVPQNTSVEGVKAITESQFTPNKGFDRIKDKAQLPQVTKTPEYQKLHEETLEMFKHSSEKYLNQHH